MKETMLAPDYIFESSWEVCNKVGGIYTVLSTRARSMQQRYKDHVIFIGPEFAPDTQRPDFAEDKRLLAKWRTAAASTGLNIRVGRWQVPGTPIAVLVDFQPLFQQKNEIYAWLWEHYQVDSLHAYGDYDEASMFAIAAAKVVESFYHYYKLTSKRVVYHANEWMLGAGMLYINNRLPRIATIFTTHATSIGRSIAGNMKPLYDYLYAYNGDQMAAELNMQSKHSIEKQAAWHADCFTTVSDITAAECRQLLEKPADVVLPNGFENSFVPAPQEFEQKRQQARQRTLQMANALTGKTFPEDTLIVSTGGRYEFRNKGIDIFIAAVNRLRTRHDIARPVLALIEVPAWVSAPRKDLAQRLAAGGAYDTPLPRPVITHALNNEPDDVVLKMMASLDMRNQPDDNVTAIFVPCYMDGHDGILNTTYYDLLIGADLCVFPSYYEPWGYTPLEAIAFHVPCITTTLAGFGLWADTVKATRHPEAEPAHSRIEDGVEVIPRTDYNYVHVVDTIGDTIERYAKATPKDTLRCRAAAEALSRQALWSEFFTRYEQAYHIALTRAEERGA